MPTLGVAIRSGLFSYVISAAISYLLWQLFALPLAWVPMVVLPVLMLVSLGKKAMIVRRPLSPNATGWKLGFQLFLVFLILDLVCVWLYDPTLTLLIEALGEPRWDIGALLLVRYILVVLSGPIAAERFRRALRKGLGFFAR